MSTIPHQKLLVILGPTSSGKSALALEVAKRWNGEIISADSRQVYRGMNIGTGKVKRDNFPPTTHEKQLEAKNASLSVASCQLYVSEGIPHHLIDIVDPDDDYNISHFLRDARKAIEDIASQGKLPIICGGTGFWIQMLMENQSLPPVPPNPDLREKLEKLSTEALFSELIKLDPKRTETIDKKNPRRLIRAIEIAHGRNKELRIENKALKVPSSALHRLHSLILALCPPKEILDAKIKARLDARFDDGMINEVIQLHADGVSWERLDAFGLEYRWISRYLRKTLPLETMKEKLFFDIIHYAKRQMTWIRKWQKKNPSLHIVETSEKAFNKIQVFLENKTS